MKDSLNQSAITKFLPLSRPGHGMAFYTLKTSVALIPRHPGLHPPPPSQSYFPGYSAQKSFSQKLLTHLRTFSLYYRQSLPSHISNSSLPMRLRLTDKMRSKAEPKAASSTGAINLNFEAEYTSRVQHLPRAENTPTARG